MDSNFSDKLKTVLSDPDAMATIAQLAKNFSQKNAGQVQEEMADEKAPKTVAASVPEPVFNPGFGDLMRQPAIASALNLLSSGSHERVALLQAMRPFVKEEKKERLDRIIQTMKMLELLGSAQKLL